MKKIIMTLLGVAVATMMFANIELMLPEGFEWDENNEVDLIGDNFDDVGEYVYTTEWISIKNTGDTTIDLDFSFYYENLPNGWMCSICNPQSCYMPNYPIPMTLQPDEEELVHIEIDVYSADTFQIYFLVNEAEAETVTYTFNFTSELTENSSNSVEVEQLNLTAYPNPFNPKTSINFNLQKNENIKIDIYNVLGKKVETLVDKNFERGSHIVDWNANELPSGIYFFKLVTSQSTATKRITLLK